MVMGKRKYGKYSREDREQVYKLKERGQSVLEISRATGIPRSTVGFWLKPRGTSRMGAPKESPTESLRRSCEGLREELLAQAAEVDEFIKGLDGLNKLEQLVYRMSNAQARVKALEGEKDRLVQLLGQRAIAVHSENSLTGRG